MVDDEAVALKRAQYAKLLAQETVTVTAGL
jgi:hypothetical protein